MEGQIKCRTCPQGQYWVSDLITASESDGHCEECPLGATCSPVDGIVPYPNYFIYTDSDRFVQARVCLPGFCETCTNQSFARSDDLVPGQVFSCCTANRPLASDNPLCGRCNSEYYLSGGDCICTLSDFFACFLLRSQAHLSRDLCDILPVEQTVLNQTAV